MAIPQKPRKIDAAIQFARAKIVSITREMSKLEAQSEILSELVAHLEAIREDKLLR